MALEDLRQARLEKLEKLIKAGEEAYPAKSWRTHTISQALQNFERHAADRDYLVLTGRIRAQREHGGSTFLDVEDGTGIIQILLKRDKLGEREYDFLLSIIDIGDFIEVYGTLFLTKREERTLEAEKYRILSKSLVPLPEKWHGLKDEEERLRKRYLDLLFNAEVRARFITRAAIIRAMRGFMERHHFLEVTTPTLQPLYGGASARPFKTHMHALDIDLYLRIAPELYLKRLLVGGYENVFEFATNFRNEGFDRSHNPEFSELELYAAYRDYEWGMQFTEELFETFITEVIGNPVVEYEGKKLNFKGPYPRLRFTDLLLDRTGLEYEHVDEATLAAKAKELGVEIHKAMTKAVIADEIFKKVMRPMLIQPTFIIDHPAEMKPLAKLTKDPAYAASFQLCAGGFEFLNAFSELNDPRDQRARFEAQEQSRAKGDEEAQRLDEDYIEALEYGMPPACGIGIGIDRLVILLTDSHSIREVILFPLMKPKTSL